MRQFANGHAANMKIAWRWWTPATIRSRARSKMSGGISSPSLPSFMM